MITDNRTDPFIRIKDSVFSNLAYQQELAELSNLDHNTVSCGSGTTEFIACIFSAYDHRGFVINSKGFAGSI